jgi:hypothetical protein
MDLGLTPIGASRKLLAVLASYDTTEFEKLLRPNAYLQISSANCLEAYLSSAEVCQALRREAKAWLEPTINVQSWDEAEDSVTVLFQIWVNERGFCSQHEHVLTVTLRDEQIEKITLCRYPVS